MDSTLVLIKPDAMQKNLAGEIIRELHNTGLELIGIKIIEVPEELAEKHYEEHKDKEFFGKLVKHLTGYFHVKKVLAMVWHGENAINKIRETAGKTNPEDAAPNTLRGKYGRIHSKTDVFENVLHTSDSASSAEKEIKLWFSPSELIRGIYPVKRKKCVSCKVESLSWK